MNGIWCCYVRFPAMVYLENVFSIIKSFLIDKSIKVGVNIQFSKPRAVNTGVRSVLYSTLPNF